MVFKVSILDVLNLSTVNAMLSRQSENVLIEQSRNVLLTWRNLGSWKTKDSY